MAKQTYLLLYIDPSAYEGWVAEDYETIQRKEMTGSEANEINQRLYADKNNTVHWIAQKPLVRSFITHID